MNIHFLLRKSCNLLHPSSEIVLKNNIRSSPKCFDFPPLGSTKSQKSDSARPWRVSDETSLNRSSLQVEDGEVVVSCEASWIRFCDELPAGCTFALFRLYVFVIPIRSFVLGFSFSSQVLPPAPPYGLCTSRRDVFFELRSKFVILKIFQIN